MSPVAEMFKWMALGLGACALLALPAIWWGRRMQRDAEVSEAPGVKCPCGEKPWCLPAACLRVCNANGRTRFIRDGKVSPRPSRWWVFGCGFFVLSLVLCIINLATGWGPVRNFNIHPAVFVALVTVLWNCFMQLGRKNRRS